MEREPDGVRVLWNDALTIRVSTVSVHDVTLSAREMLRRARGELEATATGVLLAVQPARQTPIDDEVVWVQPMTAAVENAAMLLWFHARDRAELRHAPAIARSLRHVA